MLWATLQKERLAWEGSEVTYDPRQFIISLYLAQGSLTKPSTANYRLYANTGNVRST